MIEKYKTFEELDVAEFYEDVVDTTLNQVIGLRYLPLKYLMYRSIRKLSFDLSVNDHITLSRRLLPYLKDYLSDYDYLLVKQKKRFNEFGDVDSMIELYDIDESDRSIVGSIYFEKLSDFLTKRDVIDNKSQLAKRCNAILDDL